MAAPASAAPMAASAISLAVIGKCGDIDGVWIEPVTAQVMMTLRPLAMGVEERLKPCAHFKPEVASLNMGSMNFGLFPMLGRYRNFKFDWASRPGPIQSESSMPTRTLPPIAAAWAATRI